MKALFYGVGIATLAGLLCGGAMKYAGRASENPEGPQMLVSAPSARDANPTEGAALAGYTGQVPEYVVGSDWLQPIRYEETAYEPLSPPAAEAIREAAREQPLPDPPAPEDTATVYPSADGDILAGLDAINARIAADDYAATERIARPLPESMRAR